MIGRQLLLGALEGRTPQPHTHTHARCILQATIVAMCDLSDNENLGTSADEGWLGTVPTTKNRNCLTQAPSEPGFACDSFCPFRFGGACCSSRQRSCQCVSADCFTEQVCRHLAMDERVTQSDACCNSCFAKYHRLACEGSLDDLFSYFGCRLQEGCSRRPDGGHGRRCPRMRELSIPCAPSKRFSLARAMLLSQPAVPGFAA